jgi:hypothetical protein
LDKLSEADKAEEALGVKEAYDEIVKKKENLGTKINGWNVYASYGDQGFRGQESLPNTAQTRIPTNR